MRLHNACRTAAHVGAADSLGGILASLIYFPSQPTAGSGGTSMFRCSESYRQVTWLRIAGFRFHPIGPPDPQCLVSRSGLAEEDDVAVVVGAEQAEGFVVGGPVEVWNAVRFELGDAMAG
jgi:hypothetical protein